MISSSKTSSDLFAAKGRAMPACSKPLVTRQARGPAQASPPKPDNSDDKPQDDGPASVLSIDLRRALVPAPVDSPRVDSPQVASTGVASPGPNEARPAASASRGIPHSPPPQGHGMAGPFIAALVALSIAGGVFYVFETDRYGARPVAEQPAARSAENPPSEDSARAPEAGQPQEVTAGESEADITPEVTIIPSFDLVRVEPDGSAVIAGRAAPHAELILLHNGEPIGKVKADWAGEWAFVTDKPLPADRHKITILVNDPDAAITLPEGAEPPAQIGGIENPGPR